MSEHDITLSFECCAEYAGKLWFCAFDHNGLYCVDKNKNSRAHLAGIIPGEDLYAFRLYSSIRIVEGKIVLIPFFAKDIAVYDIKQALFTKIPLKSADLFSKSPIAMNTQKFWCSTVFENNVYMFPHNYPAAVKLNPATSEIIYMSDAVEIIDNKRISGDCYLTDIFIEDNVAYFSCGCANIWLKMLLDSGKCEISDIECECNGYNGIYKRDDKLWLAPRNNGPIICVNIKNNHIDSYSDYPEEFHAAAVPFHTIYPFNGKLLFVPALANQFVLMDINTGKMRNWQQASDLLNNKRNNFYSYDIVMFNDVKNDRLCFVSGIDYTIYSLSPDNKVNSEVFRITSDYPCADRLGTGAFNVSGKKIVGESKTLGLSLLFNVIDSTAESYILNAEKGTIGDAVYEYIKKEL